MSRRSRPVKPADFLADVPKDVGTGQVCGTGSMASGDLLLEITSTVGTAHAGSGLSQAHGRD